MKCLSRKKCAALALAGVMALLSAACSADNGTTASGGETSSAAGEASTTSSAVPAEKETIVFSFDRGVGDAVSELVENYNASQDLVTVETIDLPQNTNQVHDDFATKLATGDDTVDLFAVDKTFIPEFSAAGWLQPLDEYFDEDYMSQFISATNMASYYNGQMTAIAWFTNANMLFYRSDILEDNGLEPPKTFEELEQMCKDLTGQGGTEYGITFQGAQYEGMVCCWLEYIWSNGGDVYDENGNLTVGSQNVIDGTEFMVNLAKNYAPEGITTYQETESEQVFLEGKALFHRNSPYVWAKSNAEGSKVAGKVGYCQLPAGPDGDKGYTMQGGLSLSINVNSSDSKKTACVDFIRYLLSEEGQRIMGANYAFPPVLASSYADSEVLEASPVFDGYDKYIEDSKERPAVLDYAKVTDAIQKNIHQALTGQTDVETAISNLESELEAIG